MGNNLSYSIKEKVKTYHVDFNNELRLSKLFEFIQEGAHRHANKLDFGTSLLNSEGLFWVLSRATIIIDRYPAEGQEVTIKTWPKGINKLFALRDFEISGSDGNIIAKATSAWLILSLKSHRPVNPADHMQKIHFDENYHAIEAVPGKLPLPSVESGKVFEAAYSAIDINQHVNNAKYIEWLTDCINEENHRKTKIRQIQANFNSEMKWGDKIEIAMEDKGEKLLFSGINTDSGKNVFQAAAELV